ncbi:MAG: hypothetical protein IPM94_11450 [bacterium]|nr:hypothetical protein [bacterium]
MRLLAKVRASSEVVSTAAMISDAPQALACQSAYGDMAYWKTVTVRLATGSDIERRGQKGLFSAVNSSGAVSPLTRATASSTPVIRPPRAALEGDQGGAPARAPTANAPSRSACGTSASMSSVVRATTGSMISARATAPA